MNEQEQHKLANQMVFGKFDEQMVVMALSYLAYKSEGGLSIDVKELQEFMERDEALDLLWEVDNTNKKVVFKVVPPLSSS